MHLGNVRSVFSDVALGVDDGIDPVDHGVGELLKVGRVPGQLPPAPLDVLGELLQVGGGGVPSDDALQLGPHILYGICIWRLADPLEDGDIVILKPLHDRPGLVTGRSVLHEDRAPSLGHGLAEMLLQDLSVHLGVHLLIVLNKVDVSKSAISKRSPDHQLGGVFDATKNEVGVVARDRR